MEANSIALMVSDRTVTQTDSAPSSMNAAAIAATATKGKNIKCSFYESWNEKPEGNPEELQQGKGRMEKTKAPMTTTAKGASRVLRRFQFIEPIASPKALVVAARKFAWN
jgi:hypothetical protein